MEERRADNAAMLIGERIRAIREAKHLSQGEVAERSGILRFHISRVENNHSVPSLETLEKLAHALGVPLYRLVYEGKKRPELPPLLWRKAAEETREEARFSLKLRHLLARIRESDRRLLLALAQKMAGR